MNKLFIKIPLISLLAVSGLVAQTSIKWQQPFDSPDIPEGWQVIDADQSGTGLQLVQSVNTPGGSLVLPQTGQSFWTGNVNDANLAGVIDEWLISPRISVIYAGDSLYFWAGAAGGLFDDSLRVKISTTNDKPASFIHELGYFRIAGPEGAWHRYSFDLSEFDSTDIYFAINYYIRDGGPGGQHSDFIWIDHPLISGDPGTLNQPPSLIYLMEPPDQSFVDINSTTLDFKWSGSRDLDGEDLHYTLSIVNVFPPWQFTGLADTSFSLDWKDILNENTTYRWTVEVTDSKSRVASLDTFSFKMADPTGMINSAGTMPEEMRLSQNYPNPFNPQTTIEFSIPESGYAELKVYNVLGEEVSTIVSGQLRRGDYTLLFDGKNLSTGVYFYQLTAGKFQEVKKMILMR
jgi:hypothetical protein